jgi:hypothetical protein
VNRHTMRELLRQQRDELMRRARNAQFYAGVQSVTPRARAAWREVEIELVKEARELNRGALRA